MIPAEILIYTNHQLVLKVLNNLKNKHGIPTQLDEVQITTFKNKGLKKKLGNHQGIFLRQVLAKLYKQLSMLRVKPILQNVSKLQAGSRSNKNTADQIFILISCIDHCKVSQNATVCI